VKIKQIQTGDTGVQLIFDAAQNKISIGNQTQGYFALIMEDNYKIRTEPGWSQEFENRLQNVLLVIRAQQKKVLEKDFVIFGKNYPIRELPGLNNWQRFTPSEEETQLAGTILKAWMKNEKKKIMADTQVGAMIKQKYEIFEYELYKKQYAGFINDKGKKIIWANCFFAEPQHADQFPHWQDELVFVLDGGTCVNFSPNGEA